jgi:hypothetical protein
MGEGGGGGSRRLRPKPRGEWHTFWNAGDEECRFVELITPGGFEAMFKETVPIPRPWRMRRPRCSTLGTASTWTRTASTGFVPSSGLFSSIYAVSSGFHPAEVGVRRQII